MFPRSTPEMSGGAEPTGPPTLICPVNSEPGRVGPVGVKFRMRAFGPTGATRPGSEILPGTLGWAGHYKTAVRNHRGNAVGGES
jgi:hypothetical protein